MWAPGLTPRHRGRCPQPRVCPSCPNPECALRAPQGPPVPFVGGQKRTGTHRGAVKRRALEAPRGGGRGRSRWAGPRTRTLTAPRLCRPSLQRRQAPVHARCPVRKTHRPRLWRRAAGLCPALSVCSARGRGPQGQKQRGRVARAWHSQAELPGPRPRPCALGRPPARCSRRRAPAARARSRTPAAAGWSASPRRSRSPGCRGGGRAGRSSGSRRSSPGGGKHAGRSSATGRGGRRGGEPQISRSEPQVYLHQKTKRKGLTGDI